MNKTIRLADVAKAAGVSQGTASNVFSRPQLVRAEVRERVTGIAKSMGYHGPDLKGRLLRAGKVNAIGVAAGEPLSYFFDDPFARVLMTGISEACDLNGAGLALVSAISRAPHGSGTHAASISFRSIRPACSAFGTAMILS